MSKQAAIVLGVNYYIGLSAVRALGEEGIPVIAVDYDTKAYGLYSNYVHEQVIAPHVEKDGGEALKDFLINYAQNVDKSPVLIPAADPYAIFLSRYSEELKDYYLFPQIPSNLTENLLNKRTLYQLAQQFNIPMPETFFPETEEEFAQVKEQIHFPCIVKPEFSHVFVKRFRKKVFVAEDKEQLSEALQAAREVGVAVMVQEIIPGPDDHMYTYDAYFNNKSEPVKVFTNRKIRQFPNHFGASTMTVSVFEPDLIHLGEQFLKQLGYRGIVEIEFKKSARDGKFYMIEINPRVTNFNSVIVKSGVNIPAAQYYEMVGASLRKQINQEEGLKFIHLYEDVRAALNYISNGELSVSEWLKSYSPPMTHAIYHPKDLRPLLTFWKMLIGKFANKVKRKLTHPEEE